MGKYVDILNEGKEAKEQKQNTLAAAGAKANVEKYISDRNAQATTLTAAREAALGSIPFSVDKVVGLDREIAKNAEELSTAKSLLTELF